MRVFNRLKGSGCAVATLALTIAPVVPAEAGPVQVHRSPYTGSAPQPLTTQRPTREVLLSVGEGQLINLPVAASNVWVSAPDVADVYISNSRQIHLFGKGFGEATIFVTGPGGAVIYAATLRVSQNITTVDTMLHAAMPDAQIKVINAGQVAVLTGTVASPDDANTAQQLVTAYLNPGVAPGGPTKIGVINRLKTATPLQVNLQVRIAEVSRTFVKNIGVNLQNSATGNPLFSFFQGRQGTIATVPGNPIAGYTASGAPIDAQGNPVPISASGLYPGQRAFTFPGTTGIGTSLGLAGHFLGMDLLSSLDLGEQDGQVTTLANPNLTVISGETGSFLAGGEIPIPVSQGLGAVSVEYKQYGVSLAYTPTVLADGRISIHVRPEVSQLTSAGSVTISGTSIPALSTRRAETTVELGSGQSFMIAGLLQNDHNNSISKAPGLGDLPVLGTLFRSNGWQRNETELVIVITPYLVKPVNANQIALPTDGYQAPGDLDRVLLGTLSRGENGGERPKPTMAPPAGAPAQPALGATAPVAAAPVVADDRKAKKNDAAPAPGFSTN